MPSMIPNSATLLSVFPVEVEAYRRHNGLITYVHPAALKDAVIHRVMNPEIVSNVSAPIPAGAKLFTDTIRPAEPSKGFTLLTVYDTFTWGRDFTQDQERFIPHPLAARQVADDLRRHWATDVVRSSGNFGPGIVVLDGAEPSDDDLKNVRTSQTEYFRTLVNDGHALFSRGQIKDISDLHRHAAKWLGANNLPWVPKLEQVEMKKCRACDNDIRALALVCEHCRVDLVDFYMKYGIEPDALEDPAVFKVLGGKKKKVA